MSVQNRALLTRLTRCKPGSDAHMLIANWQVPPEDEDDLTYLGGFKGCDLYYDLARSEIVVRTGDEEPDYVAVDAKGPFYEVRVRAGDRIAQAMKAAKYRARHCRIL